MAPFFPYMDLAEASLGKPGNERVTGAELLDLFFVLRVAPLRGHEKGRHHVRLPSEDGTLREAAGSSFGDPDRLRSIGEPVLVPEGQLGSAVGEPAETGRPHRRAGLDRLREPVADGERVLSPHEHAVQPFVLHIAPDLRRIGEKSARGDHGRRKYHSALGMTENHEIVRDEKGGGWPHGSEEATEGHPVSPGVEDEEDGGEDGTGSRAEDRSEIVSLRASAEEKQSKEERPSQRREPLAEVLETEKRSPGPGKLCPERVRKPRIEVRDAEDFVGDEGRDQNRELTEGKNTASEPEEPVEKPFGSRDRRKTERKAGPDRRLASTQARYRAHRQEKRQKRGLHAGGGVDVKAGKCEQKHDGRRGDRVSPGERLAAREEAHDRGERARETERPGDVRYGR